MSPMGLPERIRLETRTGAYVVRTHRRLLTRATQAEPYETTLHHADPLQHAPSPRAWTYATAADATLGHANIVAQLLPDGTLGA